LAVLTGATNDNDGKLHYVQCAADKTVLDHRYASYIPHPSPDPEAEVSTHGNDNQQYSIYSSGLNQIRDWHCSAKNKYINKQKQNKYYPAPFGSIVAG